MEGSSKKSAKGMKLTPSSSSCSITNLPTTMLMKILCRLPIKTLATCNCVCKSWRHLSRDPHFTQLHHAKAPTEVCFQLWEEEDTMKLHMGNFHCLSNFDPRDVKFNTLFEIPKFSLRMNNILNYQAGAKVDLILSNSCNGLLCYHGGNRNRFVMVWNPCTREFITIPTLAATYCCRYGLGFSGKAKKFKLLRVFCQKSKENVVAEILTIEKGCSWSTLGPCPYVWDVMDFHFPVFLHGTLHWPGSMYNSQIHIPTFDFEDDKFGRVPLPPSLGKKRSFGLCRVGELSGCLFITESTREGVNIWVMKEYGVQDSWTKMHYVPCILKGERINLDNLLLVTCMDSGEILLVGHDKFTHVYSYNPGQECFGLIGYGRGFLRVISYRPSLVPLKDSMLGYEVHVNALKHRERSTSPDWWTLDINVEKRNGHVGATSESSPLESSVAIPRLQHGSEGGESHGRIGGKGLIQISAPCKEQQIEQLKKHNQQLEERLQGEKAKVKQMKEKVQQSEQLEQRNQQLEERLRNEHAKVKQLKEKLQQSEQLKEERKQMTIQMMDEMRARFMGSH